MVTASKYAVRLLSQFSVAVELGIHRLQMKEAVMVSGQYITN